MKEVGRRLFYDKEIGNVLVNTGQLQGHVKETTPEQDIETYKALSERYKDTFDYVELEYGQYDEDFVESNGYRIVLNDAKLEGVELTSNEDGTIYSLEGFGSKYSLVDVKVFVDDVELEEGFYIELKTIVFDESQIDWNKEDNEEKEKKYKKVTVKGLKEASIEFRYPDPNEPEIEQPYQAPLSERIEELKQENELLKARDKALSERADFIEDVVAEMATQVYQ